MLRSAVAVVAVVALAALSGCCCPFGPISAPERGGLPELQPRPQALSTSAASVAK